MKAGYQEGLFYLVLQPGDIGATAGHNIGYSYKQHLNGSALFVKRRRVFLQQRKIE